MKKKKIIKVKKQKKIKNPTVEFQKAKNLFQDFNRFPAEMIKKIDLPINSKTVFVQLGTIKNLEYLSAKKIFKSDKKTARLRIRTYIHDFFKEGKEPLLLTNQEGSILILFDPKNPIEVRAEGII